MAKFVIVAIFEMSGSGSGVVFTATVENLGAQRPCYTVRPALPPASSLLRIAIWIGLESPGDPMTVRILALR